MDNLQLKEILKYSIEELIFVLGNTNVEKMKVHDILMYKVTGTIHSYLMNEIDTRLYLYIKLYQKDIRDYNLFLTPIKSIRDLKILKKELKNNWKLAYLELIKNN